MAIAQIIKQLRVRMKRTRGNEDDDFDYLYGIMTTASDWHFLLFSPGEISQAE